ncbi:MAG: acyloxyacyl hydrolase [Bacteroidota bacterium]
MMKKPLKNALTALYVAGVSALCLAQDTSQPSLHFHLQPEWMSGKIVPNYKRAPSTDFRNSLFLNFSFRYSQSNKSWPGYYHYPYAGISLSMSTLGNPDIYGNEISIIPYLMFNPMRKCAKNTFLKVGLGMAYFDRPYNPELNPANKAIGSNYNWAFQLFLYQNFPVTGRTSFMLGGGYLHASNGHTRLPNVGLNSAMISVTANVELFQTTEQPQLLSEKFENRSPFIQVTQGFGVHELGGSTGPVGGKKGQVHATSLAYGIVFKNHLKIRTGFTYRYYEHFYTMVENEKLDHYSIHPRKAASNTFFFLGSEFLIGHFSIDIEGGINLHKPMYKEFYKQYEGKLKTFKYFLKSTFPSRLGIQYYLINTDKQPKTNAFISGHINANFGQADFSSVSVGLVHRL